MLVKRHNYINPSNLEYLDHLKEAYDKDPESLEPSWKHFFDGIEFGKGFDAAPVEALSKSFLESKVALLISAYRNAGHLIADTNPLFNPSEDHPLLAPSRFGLSDKNLNETFDAGHVLGLQHATLAEIILRLKETYCRSIGAEYTHLENQEARDWITLKMERDYMRSKVKVEDKKKLLKRLSMAEGFETFLHTRYVAQKRFSLEGSEGLIPLLETLIDESAVLGTEHVVLGMAHRGRLNVLTNIFQKKARFIFTEFDDNYVKTEDMGSGDVKYHKGYSADVLCKNGSTMHLSLAYNPSHLEFVAPVVEGAAYGKQHNYPKAERTKKVLPISIHGDAAIAGQGVVYETLNFSKVDGYDTGGTIHIVINNQVGFTTDPKEARSTTYCTDIAKMMEAPVFHVNGDDPEALAWVARLAAEYRARFNESVFIDIICYRRYGHNEGDEPSFTQPCLYSTIKGHPTPRSIYAQKLLAGGLLSEAEDQSLKAEVEAHYTLEQDISKKDNLTPHASSFEGRWVKWKPTQIEEDLPAPTYATYVDESLLTQIGKIISEVPANFKINSKILKFLEARKSSLEKKEALDWATCEALAIGSLLKEGHSVRLSGQDAQRGTFTHRHGVLSDAESGEKYCQLKQLDSDQGQLEILNSTLSETGIMAFEYGYSLSSPSRLVIWEAQFGDFCNGAQVIIDQFISSSEIKWQRASGLVLYLPHGYEGQGPEHSSGRLERFLQLSAEKNITVCNLSTAGNLFHALRRQLKRSYRKPLIIMTPKSLLRFGPSFSKLSLLSQGAFQKIIPETTLSSEEIKGAKEIIICSGKIYYELLEHRTKNNFKTPIIRLEQFYPLPRKELVALLAELPNLQSVKWVQEEPRNQGAWTFFCMEWMGTSGSGFAADLFFKINRKIPLCYVGRKAAAAPAGGSFRTHQKTQALLVEAAFTLEEKEI